LPKVELQNISYCIHIVSYLLFTLASTNTIWALAGEYDTDMNIIHQIHIHIIFWPALGSARVCMQHLGTRGKIRRLMVRTDLRTYSARYTLSHLNPSA
jgi:hypothetical protein